MSQSDFAEPLRALQRLAGAMQSCKRDWVQGFHTKGFKKNPLPVIPCLIRDPAISGNDDLRAMKAQQPLALPVLQGADSVFQWWMAGK